jgi:hypothetical protein
MTEEQKAEYIELCKKQLDMLDLVERRLQTLRLLSVELKEIEAKKEQLLNG